MAKSDNAFQRGSEWRQWDLHIHTPASFHWKGKRFGTDPDANRGIVDEMVAALNAAEPAVFALMDYWTFDGWFALQQRLSEPGAPVLAKTVFPGIELRLSAPTKCRLNAHVIFSDEIEDQVLHDFKAGLVVELVGRPLSDSALIALARKVGEEKLRVHGFKKTDVDADDATALRAGQNIAEINCDSYKGAIAKVPGGLAVGFMPYDTSDGLQEVRWQDHYAYFLGLFESSPIFESRNPDLRGAFVNEEMPGNAKFIKSFQAGLNNVPRLVVSGSDAHCCVGLKGDHDKRGYGDFPSGRATWIKADPTFRGLQQAIMEPAKRSFIGERPSKLAEIAANKTYFIDRIEIGKVPSATTAGVWLDGAKLLLNPDLVAIIGNKGSGKSALTDVLALTGNSRQKAHFSFLKKDRFRGKTGDPARHFAARMTWMDGGWEDRNLNDDPPEDKVELVRYIPQGHFEDLCNAHVSGRSNAFELELRSVIFSHASDSVRLGALDFDQLIEQQERGFRHQLNEFRKDLHRVNEEIAAYEEQSQPEVRSALLELLTLKMRQIEEHDRIKPEALPKPTDELSVEQRDAAGQLEAVAAQLKVLKQRAADNAAAELALAGKLKAIKNVREHLRLLERAYKQFTEDTAQDLDALALKPADVAAVSLRPQILDERAAPIPTEQAKGRTAVAEAAFEKDKLLFKQAALKAQLNEPQLRYQENVRAVEDWKAKRGALTGTPEAPETLKGLQARIAQLDSLPGRLEDHRTRRGALAGDIFDILDAQRRAREELFKPVQDLIQKNTLIRDDYRLQFRAALAGSVDGMAASLFALVKQNSGEFRGEEESHAALRKLAEQHDFDKRGDALAFVSQLHDKIVAAAGSAGRPSNGIAAALRKDRAASDVYDLLFGLAFLEPRYSLLFQDTEIEQLSPGQRGALLLIFYLLVDRGRTPIVLDQPEENLDNETVVSLLVPVLTEAKKRRQIIMVTHNPNLAVVCDAEQVIWSCFDRKNASRISYVAGSIENPAINRHVVNVLEGTKPAFNNRGSKYH